MVSPMDDLILALQRQQRTRERQPSHWVKERVNKHGRSWEAGWRDEHGKAHYKRFPSKLQAWNFGRDQTLIAWDIIAGIPYTKKDIRQAAEEFCSRPGVNEKTHDLNRYHLMAFVNGLRLSSPRQLTRANIEKWWTIIATQGVGKQKGDNRGRPLNEGGQALALRIIRTFCYFCKANKWLTDVPFGRGVIQPIKPPKTESKGRLLDSEEREKFLYIDPRYEVDKHLYRAKMFVMYHGLRLSQVWNIKKADFKQPDQLLIPGIKGQRDRWIALNQKELAALKEEITVSDPNSERVFTFWEDTEKMRGAVRKHSSRVGLKGVRFHDGKHTFVSSLLDAGWSLPEVIEASGNSKSTIMTYAHAHRKKVDEKLKTFEYPSPDTPPS